MPLSRRRTLALLGGGVIVAAAAGGTAFALTRTPARALAPWADAGRYTEPRMAALSWAILAPNPHNRQPWAAELVGADGLRIWRDPARNLPVTDPLDRQLTIGMGCFLELLIVAASATGHGVELALFPEGEAGPVAEAVFRPGAAAADPLFAHVPARRSCKEPYAERPLPTGTAKALAPLARVFAAPRPSRRCGH